VTTRHNLSRARKFCRLTFRGFVPPEFGRLFSEIGGKRGGKALNGATNFFCISHLRHIIARLHRPVLLRMTANQTAIAERSPQARCAVSNGTRRQLFGDGRSAGARRYRDVLEALAAELGGMAALPESTRQIVRRAAQTCIECELLESRRAAGEEIDALAYSTAANANGRALARVQALKRTLKPSRPSLRDHLQRNYGSPQSPPVAA